MAAELNEAERYRTLTGPARWLQAGLLVLMPIAGALFVLDIPSRMGAALFREQYLGLFMALVLASTFLSVRAGRRAPQRTVPWYDWALAAAGLVVGGYIAVLYPSIAYSLAVITPDKWVLGVLAVVLFLEATRRLAGWTVMFLGLGFILYARFAYLFPGILQGRAVSWERLSLYLYLDTNSLMGVPLQVAATVVLAFVLFGQVLYYAGGADFLVDFALATMGRFRGGPAKMAIVSSSLFGTISGSAVANVAVDGPITIPLMKRAGYPAHLAAAIEATASTGGQLMPPVMGVAAFIIAEFLAIPYAEVALAALLPALLFYIVLFVQVHLEAAKAGITGLPPHEIPQLRRVMRKGWSFLVPLLVLVYTLFFLGWQGGESGLAGAGAALLVAMIDPATRVGWRRLLEILETTGKGLLDIGAITGVAGFMIGMLQFSGLGFKLTLLLIHLAGDSLFLLLTLTAAAAMVLGMGMPTAAVYVLLAVLVAPALVQLGVMPLAAHLFVFYFGMLSMITPPVCLATFTAAAFAKADFMRAGWAGVRLGAAAYVIPFLFAYSPELLLRGEPLSVIVAAVTAIAGAVLLAAALSGYMYQPLTWVQRILLVVAALGLLTPSSENSFLFSWAFELIGVVLAVLVLVPVWHRSRRQGLVRAQETAALEQG